MKKISRLIYLYLVVCLNISCNTNELTDFYICIPEAITDNVIFVTATTARIRMNIPTDCGEPLTACGVCWNTSPTPTIYDNISAVYNTVGSHIITITDLMPSTTYYVRAYVSNASFTTYGIQLTFTTLVE